MKVAILSNVTEEVEHLEDSLLSYGIKVAIKAKAEKDSLLQFTTSEQYICLMHMPEDEESELKLLDALFEYDNIMTMFMDESSQIDSGRTEREWCNKLAIKVKGVIDDASEKKTKPNTTLKNAGTILSVSDNSLSDTGCLNNELIDLFVDPVPPAQLEHEINKHREQAGEYNKTGGKPPSFVWVIGSSTGGPEALKRLFRRIDGEINSSIIIAQHIGAGFLDLLGKQLSEITTMSVTVAKNGDRLKRNTVYISPVDKEIQIASNDEIKLRGQNKKTKFKPCIDDIMIQVSEYYGKKSGAVVLSGMGGDCVEGVKAVSLKGGLVLIQDNASATLRYMPENASNATTPNFTGNPEELGDKIKSFSSICKTKVAG